jgi:hypothetical protein
MTLLFSSTAAAEEPVVPDSAKPAPFVAEYPAPSARGTLALTGAAVFAGWYGAALGESFLWPDAPEANKLRIPVVGPWLTVAHAGCSASETDCSDVLAVVRAILAGMTAIGQVGGLAVLGEAAFLPTERGERPLPPKRAVQVQSVTFTAGERGIGLGLSGAF